MSRKKDLDVNKMLDDFLEGKEREYIAAIEGIRQTKERYARCISHEEEYLKDLESIRLRRKQIEEQ